MWNHRCETCLHCVTVDDKNNPFDKDSLPRDVYESLSNKCGLCMNDQDWPVVVFLDNEDCYDGWDEWEPCSPEFNDMED